ncbi:MAG: class I SAM-dependent methyltransferase [Actinomycetota bacterium]
MARDNMGGAQDDAALASPVVPADYYDDHYFRAVCAGSEEWSRSQGAAVAGLYPGSLRRARLQPGEVVVDIGTGRGDLLAAAIDLGAERAIGVEYSEAGVALARETLQAHGIEDRAEVLHADARAIPLDDGVADLVTMLDVVEHLAQSELELTLRQALRVLRPGRRVFVHTLPSRTLYDVTYRLQRLSRPGRWRTWPADPRNDWERRMHVNEQTVRSLRKTLRRVGFVDVDVAPGEWLHDEFVPSGRPRKLYRRLAAHPLTSRFGAADLWGEARRRA